MLDLGHFFFFKHPPPENSLLLNLLHAIDLRWPSLRILCLDLSSLRSAFPQGEKFRRQDVGRFQGMSKSCLSMSMSMSMPMPSRRHCHCYLAAGCTVVVVWSIACRGFVSIRSSWHSCPTTTHHRRFARNHSLTYLSTRTCSTCSVCHHHPRELTALSQVSRATKRPLDQLTNHIAHLR